MDDLTLLTTPIAKGKSLIRKLRKDMSRDASRPRPYLSAAPPTESQAPYTKAIDEPLASSSRNDEVGFGERSAGKRRHRRVFGRNSQEVDHMELSNIRHPIKMQSTSQVPLHEKYAQYGSLQHESRSDQLKVINDGFRVHLDQIAGHQRTDNMQPSAGGNDRDGLRSVRWSDRQTQCVDHVDDGSERDDPGRINTVQDRLTLIPERQGPENPWTIYRGRDTYFVYGTSLRACNPPRQRPGVCDWWEEMWAPYGGFWRITSPWVFASLGLLFVANVIFLVAFVTNHWGVLYVVRDTTTPRTVNGNPDTNVLATPTTDTTTARNKTSYLQWIWDTWSDVENVFHVTKFDRDDVDGRTPSLTIENSDVMHVVNRMASEEVASEYWNFGLWQCCRNTDGLCLGPRWEAFYMTTRVLCVLSLFMMILSFAWLMGHTLEKLLDYDICTMSCLISMCYLTSIFTTIAVICFGVRWPKDFRHEFDGTDPRLDFSFYLAAFTVPLTLAAAICSTMDLKTGLDQIRENDKFYSDPDNFTDQTMAGIPRDNISRPKMQKKKRAAYAHSPNLCTSEA